MKKERKGMITAREGAVFKLALKIEEAIKEVDKAVKDLSYIEVTIAYAIVDVKLLECLSEKCKTNGKTEKDS